ncbi:MAG TPA: SpoIIE family protein phosphatase [Candidatus Polarisedimenticolaceae bacterium]
MTLSTAAEDRRRTAPRAEDWEAVARRQDEEIRSLCAEVLERYEEATFVYRLAERIAAERGESAIARMVVDDVAQVLGAPRGEVWLQGNDAFTLSVAVGTPGEGAADTDLEMLARARRGQPWVRDGDIPTVAVPLPSPSGPPLGVLVLRGRRSGRPYRAGEVKLLGAIGSLASAFLRNERLSEKARQAELRQREDELARQVHRGLLPHQDPEFEGLDVSGGFRAAEVVGGDYYGYVPMADGSLGIAMADVSGHGVGAALYMATAKGAIQSEGRRILSPAELLAQTNEVLLGDFSGMDMFATSVFVRFYPGARRFVYSNGGHNPPFLVRSSGEVVRLERGGPALGILPRVRYLEESFPFAEGDVLILYTDGIVEARDAEQRFYGLDRLVEEVNASRALPAPAIRSRVIADLERHVEGLPTRDDVTLVVARAIASGAEVSG